MDGDLSLSQSLGGLRIANPDDSSLNSEDATAPSPATASIPSSSQTILPPTDHESINKHIAASVHSLPLQDEVKSEYVPESTPELSSSYRSQILSPTDTTSSHRNTAYRSSVAYLPENPSSSQHHQNIPRSASTHVHNNHYANGSASTTARDLNNYRIRTDSSASGQDRMSRTDSRGGSVALQAGVPSRDNSHSDRSYKQAQYLTGNGPIPHRKGSRMGHNNGPGSPYALENGPPASSEDWQDRGAAVGIRQEVDANGRTVSRYIKKGVRDFSFGQTLGEGSYSTVCLGTDRQTLNEYAIKILDKRHIIKEKKVKYVNVEKDALNRLTDHPGIVRLYYTFQDERSLYFVLDYCKGGELLGVLKRMTTFDEECTQFYGAQILDTIDYMHKRGIIHRDLKPENILLDSQMHTKITDFGTAKILDTSKQPEGGLGDIPSLDSTDPPEHERASSFVGTAEYVSPELLTDKNACKASDLWAFGCIIFQLLAGRPPFKAANEYLTFQKIVALEYEFPTGFPPVARDLVERLLVLDPARRLPIEHIKNHQFFDGITWGRGLWKQKAPRLKAYVPPPREPIKLSGGGDEDSFPPNISSAPSGMATAKSTRAYPRVITELPPPSQLDIEWSPVLKKDNERILKLGILNVMSSNASHSPGSNGNGDSEPPRKFSRFFGGSTTKKKQRLVMITSQARIILTAAGGDEKRAKLEISLLAPKTTYRSTVDAKGSASWIVDTRDKHFVFEEPKPGSSSVPSSANSIQEWIDTLDRAKELAMSQQSNAYSGDEYRDLSSEFSSHANTLDHSSDLQTEVQPSMRATLQKNTGDNESLKGKKRFSKRHSKNGLAAVF
ncbi:serine/threonine protein kinase [Talaromyces marneffei ATCC 18224]|uniref:non-specific serine/threonine protein kinase n=2 Tax=Talaromyces marneffei TaxID=37727 RepID=B6Q5C7_TALMQ|nr:uncharacterized protein EYB26_000732 [Talaromyces marneffei]EEA27402.1 serine/threonine protein kinase, putative [Talaromyces marneffei ATCC 18224]QGA13087.1 hypothetical protein EYB26_000732 [Talaromyces marneffei]